MVDVENIDISNRFALVKDDEVFIINNYELFNKLTELINSELKAILLDNYILSLKGFTAEEYFEKVNEFNELYDKGIYYDRNSYNLALDYLCNYLKQFDLLLYNNDNFENINGKSILIKISSIYENSKKIIDIEDYKDLKRLVDYIDSKYMDYTKLYLGVK